MDHAETPKLHTCVASSPLTTATGSLSEEDDSGSEQQQQQQQQQNGRGRGRAPRRPAAAAHTSPRTSTPASLGNAQCISARVKALKRKIRTLETRLVSLTKLVNVSIAHFA